MSEVLPAPKPGERIRAALWLLGVLAIVCGVLGGAGYGIYRFVTAEPDVQAVDGPVDSVSDLEKVCFANRYFPQAPGYDTPGPHPVEVFVKDDGNLLGHVANIGVHVLDENPDVWSPRDLAPVQIVGCALMRDSGKIIKQCSFDKPRPATAEMKVATYEFTVYEVKTRKKLGSSTMVGMDETCPPAYDIGNDRGIFSQPTPKQLIEAVRPHVEKA